MFIIEIIYNLTQLVALSVISGFVEKNRKYPWSDALVQGLIFGAVAVIGILRPMTLAPGLIFDGRSVVLSLCGLFFGPWAAFVAGMMALVCRVLQGGIGVWMGSFVIVTSCLWGILFYYQWTQRNVRFLLWRFWLFGILVHITMLVCVSALPREIELEVLQKIGWPVLLLYPLATILIGKILSNIFERRQAEEALRVSEIRYRNLVDLAVDGILLGNPQEMIIDANKQVCEIFGMKREELIGKHVTKLPFSQESVRRVPFRIDLVRQGKTVISERSFIRPDGCEIFIEMHSKIMPEGFFQSIIRDITERKQIENRLRASEKGLQEAQHIAQVGNWELDLVRNVFWWSEEVSRILEIDPKGRDISYEAFLFMVHPEDRHYVHQLHSDSIKERISTDIVYRLLMKNGDVKHVNEKCRIECDAEGRPLRSVGTIQDITKLKKVENDLRQARHFTESVLNASPGLIYIYDLRERRNVYANHEVLDFLGYTAEKIKGMGDSLFQKILHPDDAAIVDRHHVQLKAARDKDVLVAEYRMKRADGQWRWLHSRDVVFARDREKKVFQILGVAYDITERKQAEETLRESEKRYHLLFDTMLEGFALHEIICDDSGRPVDYRFLDINPAFEKITGLKAKDIIGKTVREVLPVTETYWIEAYGQVALTGNAVSLENYSKGLSRYFRVMAFSPKRGQFAVMFDDITERKKAEEQLRQSESNYREIFNSTSDAIFIHEIEGGRLVDVNEAMLRMYGYATKEEVLSCAPEAMNQDQSPYTMVEVVDRVRRSVEEGPQTFEWLSRKKSGESFWVEVALHCAIVGGRRRALAVVRDINDRKKAEEVFRLAKESAEAANKSKSEFLANVSHDLRTPLNSIVGFCTLLNSETAVDQRSRMIEIIHGQSRNVLSLINEILDVSRLEAGKIEMRCEEFDLQEIVGSAIDLIRLETEARNIQVICSYDKEISRLKGDRIRVGQVLNNMLSNALKYTEQGQIMVKVDRTSKESPLGKCCVRFSVKDTGLGIPKDKLGCIFDPFVRAHEFVKGKDVSGVGLGLFISKTFINLMGGDISVVSEEGKGSEFVFTLKFRTVE